MADMTEVSNFDELNFLWEISDILAGVNDAALLLDGLKTIFEKYLSVNNFQIFIKDESTSTLRDFVKDWIIIEKNQQQELVENIFNKLKSSYNKGFILNNKLLKYDKKLSTTFCDTLKQDKNLLYFPVLFFCLFSRHFSLTNRTHTRY